MTRPERDPTPTRLERALEIWLQFCEAGSGDAARLLADHPDLRDLLEPMLTEDDAERVDGQVIGDFRLVRELGRGGMGIVYEAWQRSLDRRVALKLLSPALCASTSAIARFRREAAAVGRLRHPGIVEVHGLHSDNDRHCFAMGLVDGEALTRCRERFRAPAAAVALAVQIVDALQHAHARGLVHRDVKPGNVLVRADGSAVLTDFGLAHDEALPSVTTDGSFLGTLDYASPEQLQGAAIDARTDLWSIGVVLYELLAGKRPFARDTATATMKAVLTAEPPPLRRSCPEANVDLQAIVDRTLQKEPARRYASAGALLADLRAWQSGGVVSVRAPTPAERLLRWTRREPWRATAIAVLLLATPIVLGLYAYLQANTARIQAATSAENEALREQVFADAWSAMMAFDVAAMRRALDNSPPGGDARELAFWRALSLDTADTKVEAIAALAPFHDPVADLLRALLEGRPADPLAVPTAGLSAFDCFLLAAKATQMDKGRPPLRDRIQRTFELATLAVTLSPRPRLSHVITWGMTAASTKDPWAMAAAASTLARQFPDAPQSIEQRADLLQESDPVRSLAMFEQAWAGRETALFHNNRGTRLQQLKRLAEAEAAFRAAVGMKADYGLAWTNLGNVLRREDRNGESLAALQKAVELQPTNARAWNGLGLTQYRLGQKGEAKAAYARAVELEPDYAVAIYNLAGMEEEAGDLVAGARLYRRAIAADPRYLLAIVTLGNLLCTDHRPQEALLEYMRGMPLAPDDAQLQTGLARAALDCGLGPMALAAAEHAMRTQDSVARRILAARAKALTGDAAGAAAMLDAAEREPKLAQDPDRAELASWRTKLQPR